MIRRGRANFARMTGFINRQIRFQEGINVKSLPEEAFFRFETDFVGAIGFEPTTPTVSR